jgi:hypothetical protein
MKFISIFSLAMIALACNNNSTTLSSSKKKSSLEQNKSTHLFLNPYFLPNFLEDIDIKYYPFIFNANTGLNKANYFVKNGRLPNNISEKYTYLFNSSGKLNSLSHFSQATNYQPYTDFIFHYSADNISKMEIIKYMQNVNQPPIQYIQDSLYSLIIEPKTEFNNDSTYFFPSFENPKLIYTRSNNKTIEATFYFPQGTSMEAVKKEILNANHQVKLDDFTYLYVTYTDNNLPIETLELTQDLEYFNKIRTWEYNSNWQPIRYREYLMSNLIKDLSIEYNKKSQPTYIQMNKKVFYAYYE